MSGFTVRPYEPGDEEGILRLFNTSFSEGNPGFVPRTLETWRHIYARNPAGQQVFVALDAERNVIANYSGIPASLDVRGQRRWCTQSVDTCVHRAWRGSLRKNSVFVTIAKAFIQEYSAPEGPRPCDIMWGLPNQKAFPVGTRIIGYQPVHCPMPSQVAVLESAWIEGLAAHAEGVEVSEGGLDAYEQLGGLFERTRDEVELGVWRDAQYLGWRYRDWPGSPYGTMLARRNGELVGGCVFRRGWMDQPIVPIVEWFGRGGDRSAVAGLLATIARKAQGLGGRRLETWVTPSMTIQSSLRALGLVEEPTPFNLCIMVFSPSFDLEWAKAHWFVTMGDSDLY